MPTIMIVGGAMASGGALALRLLSQGAKVVLVDPAASSYAAGLHEFGINLFALDTDLTRSDLGEVALAFCHERAGMPDGLFVNMHRSTAAPLDQWNAEMFDTDIAYNLTVPFFLARAVAQDMILRSRGAIVFTGSTAGLIGASGKSPFHAAKAALSGMCRAFAEDFGQHNIRVNCLMPGWIDSPSGGSTTNVGPIIPIRRLGLMEEVAAAAHFLLEQPYIHGTELVIDGGYTATDGLHSGKYETPYDRRIV